MKYSLEEIEKKIISINFYWDKEGFIVILVNNTGLKPSELVNKIEKMLDEYREKKPDYNSSDWIEMLEDIDGLDILTAISYYRNNPDTDYSIYF